MRIFQAHALRFAVHQHDKRAFIAGHGFGQRDGGVVTRLNHQAMQQVIDRHRSSRVDEHLRAAGVHFPRARGDIHFLVQRQFLFADGGKRQVGRHDLGERGRFDARVRILRSNDLAAGGVEQQPGLGGDGRGRKGLRKGGG